MRTIIDRAYSRGHADHGWLQTSHTFSFADYYNPARIHFGALRVLNDDKVAPDKGFDFHPHKNMEIVSIPLKGALRHGDNLEHSDVITPGDIQVMSAGTGIIHSEFNGSSNEWLEFLQIWIIPKGYDTPPLYKNYDIRETLKKNHFSLIVSPDGDAPAKLLQDTWFSLGELDKGLRLSYSMHRRDTGVYCFVIEGKIRVGDITLSKRDGMGICETDQLHIETLETSYVLLIEVSMG